MNQMTTFTTDDIQKWQHSELTAFMINTWELKVSIYILTSFTHNNNNVRAVDWDNNKADSRNMCLIIIFRSKFYNRRSF